VDHALLTKEFSQEATVFIVSLGELKPHTPSGTVGGYSLIQPLAAGESG
jgi:hypothetical protein